MPKTGRSMSQSQNERFAKIEKQNQALEEKVEALSSELREKNNVLEDTFSELKRIQDQLVMQERLASLGALTAGIAHEIKNPLNFVNNFAVLSVDLAKELEEELSTQQNKLDEETYSYILDILKDIISNAAKISEHGARADSIVKGMLAHSRGSQEEMESTDFNYLVEEYINLAYHGMRAKESSFNVKIEKDLDESVGEVSLNPQAFSRVLLNIANNGFYATHYKNKRAGSDYHPEISFSTRNLGDKVELKIRDNGPGIPEEVRAQIFNPFFTTKPTGDGTGLGLSISYDIVTQMHGGDIQVETADGEFTEFIITLPKEHPPED